MAEDYSAYGSRFGYLIEKLNGRLRPYLGGAQLGDPDERMPEPLVDGGSCPLCRAPMDGHVVDRSGPRTMVHCPA